MSKAKTTLKIAIPVIAIIIVSVVAIQRMRVNSFIATVEQSNTLGAIEETASFDADSCNLTVLQGGGTVLSLFNQTGELNLDLVETINGAPPYIKNQLAQNIEPELDKALNCGALTQVQIDAARNALTFF